MSTLSNLGLGMEVASSAGNIAGSMVDLFTRKKRREEQFAREDNAVQRRAADLEAAGLSKTLAAGSAASATPVSARSTQSKVGVSQAVLANAQKDLTSAKINESKTQQDLNRSATNLNNERAGLTRQQQINAGYEPVDLINRNTLSSDKATNIPRERDLFESIGWTYYKDMPGASGEIARALSSLASATTGLAKSAMEKLQPLFEKFESMNFPNWEERNTWIEEKLEALNNIPGNVKAKIKEIFMNPNTQGVDPAQINQWQNNDRNRNQLPYY